jgi:hypothetical protein
MSNGKQGKGKRQRQGEEHQAQQRAQQAALDSMRAERDAAIAKANQTTPATEERASNSETSQHDPAKEASYKKWTIIFAAAASVGAIIQGGGTFFQWNIANDQLDVMRTQTKEMATQVVVMKKAIEQTDQLIKMNQESSVEEQEMRQLEQRAWVGIKHIKLAPMAKGKPLVIEVGIYNSGKTFALEIEGRGMLYFYPNEQSDGAVEDRYTKDRPKVISANIGVVFPGDDDHSVPFSASVLTDEQIANIQTGKVHIYIIGDFKYDDTFGIERRTRFSNHYAHDFGRFESTGRKHNDAN